MKHPCLQPITDEALDAFWEVLVKRFPQAKTGDLSPLATIALQIAAEDAVCEWVNNNVPGGFGKSGGDHEDE